MFWINIFSLVLFPIAYFASSKFGIDWLKFLPGILLLYYLPGTNLNSIIFKHRNINLFTLIPVNILSSIALNTFVYLAFKSKLNYSEFPIVSYIYILNLLIFLISYFLREKSKVNKLKLTKSSILKFVKQNKTILIILLIPLLGFAIRLILNPYIYDIDSLVYYDAYQKILSLKIDQGLLFRGREVFPFLVISSRYVAGLSYIVFFKFFTPLIFYFTSIILLSFINKKTRLTGYIAYLLILASPMLTIMNESVRPETIILFLSLPILSLIYLGIKNNDVRFAGLALAYAILALGTHESGNILLLSSFLGIVILVIVNFGNIRSAIRKNPWLSFFIAAPYLAVLILKFNLFVNYFTSGMTGRLIQLIGLGLSEGKITWWFLGNAVTNTGAELSWPGYTAVYYYLYDGIILLIFALICLIFYLSSKRSSAEKVSWLALTPTLVFFFAHFVYAEILPRLGVILYPNRSWPHIMIALVFVSFILILGITTRNKSAKPNKVIPVLLILTITSGGVGATLGSTMMGAMVSPNERQAIQAIRNLPEDSVIISSQRNHNLVKIYGGKQDFIYLKESYHKTEYYNPETFNQTVLREAKDAAEQVTMTYMLDPIVLDRLTQEVIIKNDREVLFKQYVGEPKHYLEYDEKMKILEQFDNNFYNYVKASIDAEGQKSQKQLYFFYSFAKLDGGIISTRPWWRSSSDEKNYQFFKNFDDQSKIVAKDKNFILIKIDK